MHQKTNLILAGITKDYPGIRTIFGSTHMLILSSTCSYHMFHPYYSHQIISSVLRLYIIALLSLNINLDFPSHTLTLSLSYILVLSEIRSRCTMKAQHINWSYSPTPFSSRNTQQASKCSAFALLILLPYSTYWLRCSISGNDSIWIIIDTYCRYFCSYFPLIYNPFHCYWLVYSV